MVIEKDARLWHWKSAVQGGSRWSTSALLWRRLRRRWEGVWREEDVCKYISGPSCRDTSPQRRRWPPRALARACPRTNAPPGDTTKRQACGPGYKGGGVGGLYTCTHQHHEAVTYVVQSPLKGHRACRTQHVSQHQKPAQHHRHVAGKKNFLQHRDRSEPRLIVLSLDGLECVSVWMSEWVGWRVSK